MHHVYLLRSVRDGGYYIGRTDNLKRRLSEHNGGVVESTKSRRPLMLVYYETYIDAEQADMRERKLKDFGSSYTALLKRLGLR